MENERIKNQQLNNLYLQNNITDIRANAPRGAMCFIIDSQEVVGYYDNWTELMDGFGLRAGAVFGEL